MAWVALLAACGPAAPTAQPAATAAPTAAPATPAPTSTVAAAATVAPTAILPAPTVVPPTVVPPTTAPTSAPAAGARIAVQAPDNSVQLVDAAGNKQPFYQSTDPVDLSSIFPDGNVLAGALYLPFPGANSVVMRIDAKGAQKLAWITGSVSGIAVSASRLAWGTANMSSSPINVELWVSALDGSQPKSILKETYTGVPLVMRPMRWSADGTRMYFGKEPTGLGGYILFAGRTNVWSYDANSGKSSELLPARAQNEMVCIDDLSPNEKLTVDHCDQKDMRVTTIASKATAVISAPPDVKDFAVVGGARFSPDSTRLAYGLARHDPENEQGWVAVSNGLSGASKLVATSAAKDYFSVAAWLDANTLVLQSAFPAAGIWTVGVDGKNLKRIADGTFLGIVTAK